MAKDVDQFFKEMRIPEGGSIAWSAPAISGNRLVFGACDRYLYCLDKNTGKLIWKFLTGGPIVNPPNVVKDKVFFPSQDKHLYCLSMKTGELIWKRLFPQWPISPTFSDGMLYLGCTDNNFYALSADDGSKVWSFRTGKTPTALPAVINSSICFGSLDNNFYCLDMDGRLKWKFRAGGPLDWSLGVADKGQQAWSMRDRNGNKEVADGMIYFGCYDNHLYALSTEGDFRWKFLTGNIVPPSPAIFNSRIYFGSWDKNFYCLDSDSGAMKWRFVTGGFIDTPPLILGGFAYFGSYDQNMYALGLDGSRAWTFTTGGFVVCPPVVADGVLYFGSCDTYMYAIRLSDKKLLWKFQTGMPAASLEHLLKEFTDIVQASRQPFTFSDWKPETLKKSYGWSIEMGHLVTSPYKSENPYMNKPVYRTENPYDAQKKKKEPWER